MWQLFPTCRCCSPRRSCWRNGQPKIFCKQLSEWRHYNDVIKIYKEEEFPAPTLRDQSRQILLHSFLSAALERTPSLQCSHQQRSSSRPLLKPLLTSFQAEAIVWWAEQQRNAFEAVVNLLQGGAMMAVFDNVLTLLVSHQDSCKRPTSNNNIVAGWILYNIYIFNF